MVVRQSKINLLIKINDMNDLNNLEKMFQSFTEAASELQKTQGILQKKVEDLTAELEETNKELRKKERLAEIGAMSASIAHEIRNPLGGIELFASLIKRSSAEKEQELCNKILSGVSRLNHIVEDLLSYAKDFVPQKEEVNLNSFVESLRDYIEPDCTKKEVAFEIVLVKELKTIICDKVMLFQVLLNLLRNAAQAAPEKGMVKLTISQGNHGTFFKVEDNGEGISPENKQRIFQPFFTTKSTGSGLGLAIVNRYIEAHSGKITVDDSEFGGAKFEVYLPYVDK
jgi:signal transduction histidine kinase